MLFNQFSSHEKKMNAELLAINEQRPLSENKAAANMMMQILYLFNLLVLLFWIEVIVVVGS